MAILYHYGTTHTDNWDSTSTWTLPTFPLVVYVNFPERAPHKTVKERVKEFPEEEPEYVQPNIHQFMRELPDFCFEPRVDAQVMSRVHGRMVSMEMYPKRPLMAKNNKKKHKEFFNRNAMVHIFCSDN